MQLVTQTIELLVRVKLATRQNFPLQKRQKYNHSSRVCVCMLMILVAVSKKSLRIKDNAKMSNNHHRSSIKVQTANIHLTSHEIKACN